MLIARRIRKATAADRAGVLLLLKVRVLGRRAAVQVHAGSTQHLLLLRRRGHTRRTALLLLLSGHSVRAQGRVRVAVIASTAATARRSHSSSSLLVLAHGLLLLLHATAAPSPEGSGPHAVLAHAAHLLLVLRLHSPHPAPSVGLLLAQHRCAHHPAGGASSHRRRGAVVRLLWLLVQRVLAMSAPHVVLVLVVHVRGTVATVLLARRRIAAHHALVLHFQPLAADLEAVHGLDRRVCVLQCVVRNESCTSNNMYDFIIRKEKPQSSSIGKEVLPKPLESEVFLSTNTFAEMTLPKGANSVAKSASVRSRGKW